LLAETSERGIHEKQEEDVERAANMVDMNE
jgi:hypothetical protein